MRDAGGVVVVGAAVVSGVGVAVAVGDSPAVVPAAAGAAEVLGLTRK